MVSAFAAFIACVLMAFKVAAARNVAVQAVTRVTDAVKGKTKKRRSKKKEYARLEGVS